MGRGWLWSDFSREKWVPAEAANFNYPVNNQHRPSQQAFLSASWPAYATNHPALFAGMVAALIVIGLVLAVLFTYIGKRDAISFCSTASSRRNATFARAGARRKGPGLRLFWWQIVFGLASFAALLIVIGIPVACAWAGRLVRASSRSHTGACAKRNHIADSLF